MCPVHLDWEKTTNLSQATNNLITEQEDVSSTPGLGENHQSVTSH